MKDAKHSPFLPGAEHEVRATGSSGSFPLSRIAAQGRRPSRARRPALGMERCEERTLLSIALVSVNATGTAVPNGNSDFDATTVDEPRLRLQPRPSQTRGPERRRNEAGVRQRRERPGRLTPMDTQPRDRRIRPRHDDRADVARQRDSRRPARQRRLVRSRDQPQRPVRRFRQPGHELDGRRRPDVSTFPTRRAVGDLYVRDLQTGTTTLLDQTPSGQASDGFSTGQFVFSPDSTHARLDRYLGQLDDRDARSPLPTEQRRGIADLRLRPRLGGSDHVTGECFDHWPSLRQHYPEQHDGPGFQSGQPVARLRQHGDRPDG